MKITFYKAYAMTPDQKFYSFYFDSQLYELNKRYAYSVDECDDDEDEDADDEYDQMPGYCGAHSFGAGLWYAGFSDTGVSGDILLNPNDQIVVVECEGELLQGEIPDWKKYTRLSDKEALKMYSEEIGEEDEECYQMPEFHFTSQKIVRVVAAFKTKEV